MGSVRSLLGPLARNERIEMLREKARRKGFPDNAVPLGPTTGIVEIGPEDPVQKGQARRIVAIDGFRIRRVMPVMEMGRQDRSYEEDLGEMHPRTREPVYARGAVMDGMHVPQRGLLVHQTMTPILREVCDKEHLEKLQSAGLGEVIDVDVRAANSLGDPHERDPRSAQTPRPTEKERQDPADPTLTKTQRNAVRRRRPGRFVIYRLAHHPVHPLLLLTDVSDLSEFATRRWMRDATHTRRLAPSPGQSCPATWSIVA